MQKQRFSLTILILAVFMPSLTYAQTAGQGIAKMHTVLWNVYNQMIPLCSSLIKVSQAIAGIGAIFYIGNRVWKHIARAEPVDFYPLLRPFALTLLIAGFNPIVLGTLNGVLQPTVTATASIVDSTNAVVINLLSQEANAAGYDTAQQVAINPYPEGDYRGSAQYTNPSATTTGGSDSGGFWSSIGSGLKFMMSGIMSNMKIIIEYLLSILLQLLYYAASLCIDTIRTFHLIILAILGPLAFAFSCYDGLHQSVTHWLARYVNIYLWLPIANIFGAILAKIQANMLQLDLAGGGAHFVQTDITYLIFLVIGIIGYTTVPGIANYIIHTHGGNPLAEKVGNMAGAAVQMAASAATGVPMGGSGGGSGGGGGAASSMGYSDNSGGSEGGASSYNRKQLEG